MTSRPIPPEQRRQLVRDLIWVTLAASILRVAAAAIVAYPPFTDAAYYTMAAQQLASGHGFTVPAMWSFLEVGGRLPADPSLPVPGFAHFQPLASLVATAPLVLFGDGWRVAQIPFVILSVLLVPMTYLIGWDLWRTRAVALGGAILALLAGPVLVMYPLVDNFAVFGVAGVVALYAASRAARAPHPAPWFILSGAFVGIAALARIDGLLLAVATAIAWWLRVRETGLGRAVAIGIASLAACLVVLAPWLARNLATFGALFPSAGGHTLWITSYNDQFSIGHPITLERYLATGPVVIIGSKLGAWMDLLGRTAVLTGGIFVVFFIAGLWIWRHERALQPFIGYWIAMFVVMGGVFTFFTPHGAFYHSAPAWLPFAFPMAVASLTPTCNWLGRWWRLLARPPAQRFLLAAGLVGAVVLSVAGSAVLLVQWDQSHRQDVAVARFLRDQRLTGAVVMSDDPASLWVTSGNPGVPIPFDPYPVIERAARSYGARYLVVNVRPGETTDPLGLWAGGNSLDADGNRASWLATSPTFEAPGVRVYQIVQ